MTDGDPTQLSGFKPFLANFFLSSLILREHPGSKHFDNRLINGRAPTLEDSQRRSEHSPELNRGMGETGLNLNENLLCECRTFEHAGFDAFKAPSRIALRLTVPSGRHQNYFAGLI
jgi:hypothetical protein